VLLLPTPLGLPARFRLSSTDFDSLLLISISSG